MYDTDREIMQLRNAQLWNEQKLLNAPNERDAKRYEQNVRDIGDCIYDLIRYDSIRY